MEKTMIVRGEGNISIKPDYIIIDIEIIGFNKNYNLAMADSKLKYDSLMNSLNSIGFKSEDLKTIKFYIETVYENKLVNNNYEKVFLGYKFFHQLSIDFYMNMNVLNKTINIIMSSSSTPNLNIKFTIKDKTIPLNILLKKTIQDAISKAMTIAENLNVNLNDIIHIDYTQKNFQIYSATQFAPKMVFDQEINITPSNIELNDFITITWTI